MCLMAQWLSLCSSTAKGMNSIPGWGTKILHAPIHLGHHRALNSAPCAIQQLPTYESMYVESKCIVLTIFKYIVQ